jgi:hypothetical protein
MAPKILGTSGETTISPPQPTPVCRVVLLILATLLTKFRASHFGPLRGVRWR